MRLVRFSRPVMTKLARVQALRTQLERTPETRRTKDQRDQLAKAEERAYEALEKADFGDDLDTAIQWAGLW